MANGKEEEPKGTGVIISPRGFSSEEYDRLGRALDAFEYGEEEESDEGFKELSEIAGSQQDDSTS